MRPARHPYRLTPARQLAAADADRHIADLVRLVLLTRPGERLHEPDFGAGLGASALFEPLETALLAVVEARARGSLEQSLGDRIELVDLIVSRQDETAIVASVTYRLRPAGDRTSLDVAVRA